MKQKIILLNGASSSGKSTLSIALQKSLEEATNEKYAIISLDDYLAMSVKDEIFEDDVFEISGDMCRTAVDMLNSGTSIIIDHVITSERIYKQLIKSLEMYNLYKIHVDCPLEELKRREIQRGNRHLSSAEASLKYLYPSEGYHMIVNTFENTTEQCVEQIKFILEI